MDVIAIVLVLAALICFLLATFGASVKYNMVALGLALLSLYFLFTLLYCGCVMLVVPVVVEPDPPLVRVPGEGDPPLASTGAIEFTERPFDWRIFDYLVFDTGVLIDGEYLVRGDPPVRTIATTPEPAPAPSGAFIPDADPPRVLLVEEI